MLRERQLREMRAPVTRLVRRKDFCQMMTLLKQRLLRKGKICLLSHIKIAFVPINLVNQSVL